MPIRKDGVRTKVEQPFMEKCRICAESAESGDPYGIRTRVGAVKGRCPRPLDEGVSYLWNFVLVISYKSNPLYNYLNNL